MSKYTIKEVSEMTKLPAHTIRYYENEGLLPFIQRDENGYRIFEEKDLGWIDFITCLKVTGMSMNDLREIITLTVNGENNFDLRRSILLAHRQKLEEEQLKLDKAFNKVAVKMKYFDDLEEAFNKQATTN